MTISRRTFISSVAAASLVPPRTVVAASADTPAPAPPERFHEVAGKNIALSLSVEGGCRIDTLTVGGRQLLDPRDGITTSFLPVGSAAPLTLQGTPQVTQQHGVTVVSGIRYDNPQVSIRETWRFVVAEDTIVWTIERDVSAAATLAELSSPRLVLRDDTVFDTALLDNGGSAWFRLLDTTPSALGQNIRQATYWKRGEPWCLAVAADSPGGEVASRFAREADGRISQTIYAAPTPPVFKSESGVNLTRFLRRRTDVFAPVELPAGHQVVTLRFTARKADALYDRGHFTFVAPETLTTIANTIARVGVIDRHLMGGNNFHTGYVCLHEQYIAELGLFIDDPEYFEAYRHTLDYYRDHALQPDGRVKSRFDYDAGDSVRGTFDTFGFYECQWGFLLDSQPDFVINVCTLFDINGDRSWLATHKSGCERALDYLLALDTDADGLVEMKNDSRTEHKSSDWIDIVWASHKNAFVNAKLYHAIRLWSRCEGLLGDPARAAAYSATADKLKARFNQTTDEGGCWDPARKCYIHWREKDDSLHGTNMVTPVNFMAIVYGLCDDAARTAVILDQIESTDRHRKTLLLAALPHLLRVRRSCPERLTHVAFSGVRKRRSLPLLGWPRGRSLRTVQTRPRPQVRPPGHRAIRKRRPRLPALPARRPARGRRRHPLRQCAYLRRPLPWHLRDSAQVQPPLREPPHHAGHRGQRGPLSAARPRVPDCLRPRWDDRGGQERDRHLARRLRRLARR